jgi:2-haloacid dehalogenase
MKYEALVFDAYGTLFDVHSVSQACEDMWPGKGAELSRLWRVKQLEYTWQRSLMRRYEHFWQVTEDALYVACAMLGLKCGEPQAMKLMECYLHLSVFPDTLDALKKLSGHKLAILSNGSPEMLEPMVRNAGLTETFASVMSVDSLQVYKPEPRVYRLAVETLGIAPENIGFVSSNCWDALGAKAFGFSVFWINRSGAPVDALGCKPDYIVSSLGEVPALVAAA